MGLPCSYIIYERKKASGVIRYKDIYLYWYFDYTTLCRQDLDQSQVLEPLVICGKGRPKGALGGVSHKSKGVHDTRRLPSAFELPSSSAPAAIETQPARREQLYIVQSGQSSTSLAMSRLQEGQVDLYEPGTVRERAYMRGISSIYHTDSMVDLDPATIADNLIQNETQDCIEVDIGGGDSDGDGDSDVSDDEVADDEVSGMEVVQNETQDCIEVEVGNSFI